MLLVIYLIFFPINAWDDWCRKKEPKLRYYKSSGRSLKLVTYFKCYIFLWFFKKEKLIVVVACMSAIP